METLNFHPLVVSIERMSAANKSEEKEDASAHSDSGDDFKYEEVHFEDEGSLTEGEEDLDATIKAIKHRAEVSAQAALRPQHTHQPEAVDDFLRNFLIHMGMMETLDCFQMEWTEMAQKGQVDAEKVGAVPDVYADIQRLERELRNAKRERDEYTQAVSAAEEILERVQRARDFHRRQHKRVVQEKNRLIEEMRKLKVQCDNYEPAVKRMNEKYQAVLKQTMLVTLERDKALQRLDQQSAQHISSSICPRQDTREESKVSKGKPVLWSSPPSSPSSPAPPRSQSIGWS